MKRLFLLATIIAAPAFAGLSHNQPITTFEKPDWVLPPQPSQGVPDWDLSMAGATPKADPQEVACLARNIYHEARGQSIKGQQAVALVTLNRLDEDESVCDVVFEHAQFSWTLYRKLWRIKNWQAYRKAKQIAAAAIEGRINDFTNGATHYYAYKVVRPYWAKYGYGKKVIGDHVFMRLTDTNARANR